MGPGNRIAGQSPDASFRLPPVPEPVGDRIPAVSAKILAGDLDARRRLAALVFGDVEKMLDAVHGGHVMAAGDDLLDAQLMLDKAFEDVVERRIGRQRILVGLVGPEFGRRRLVDDVFAGSLHPRGRARRAARGCCASGPARRPAFL